VGTDNQRVWVRVEGKGSFLNSGGLKEFAREMTERGYRDFAVDLRNCPVMDSTFMGTLAGIALRLNDIGEGELCVVNLNERNRDLLANLGLDQLFRMAPVESGSGQVAQEVLPVGGEDKESRARTMLEAHEACVEANPENAAKFKDVLEYLKEDLRKSG
jgi:anti-sigma B factor antagonist